MLRRWMIFLAAVSGLFILSACGNGDDVLSAMETTTPSVTPTITLTPSAVPSPTSTITPSPTPISGLLFSYGLTDKIPLDKLEEMIFREMTAFGNSISRSAEGADNFQPMASIPNIMYSFIEDVTTSQQPGYYGVYCRYQDEDNYYVLVPDGIWKKESGTYSMVANTNYRGEIPFNRDEYFFGTISAPEDHELRNYQYSCDGNEFRVYRNGLLHVVGIDTIFQTGESGMFFLDSPEGIETIQFTIHSMVGLDLDKENTIRSPEVLSENFSDNKNSLYCFDNELVDPEYTGIIVDCIDGEGFLYNQQASDYSQGHTWQYTVPSIYDVQIDVDYRYINEFGYYLFNFRQSPVGYYRIKITQEGNFSLVRVKYQDEGNEYDPLINLNDPDDFWKTIRGQNASGETNHLRVVAIENKISIFINEALIFYVEDSPSDYLAYGSVGVGVGAFKDEGGMSAEVAIDNLIVYEISADEAVSELRHWEFRPFEVYTPQHFSYTSSDSGAGYSSYLDEENTFHYSMDSLDKSSWYYYGPDIGDQTVAATLFLSSNGRGSAGLVCRASSQGMYGVQINPSLGYVIFRYDPSNGFVSMNDNGAWKKSAAIKQTRNHLKLECKGNEISLYINDEFVGSVMDDAFQSGSSGPFITQRKGKTQARFLDLVITP